MGWTVRAATADDMPDFVRAVWAAFGSRAGDAQVEEARAFLEVDRAYVAVDAGEVVGTACMLSFELTVPGPNVVRTGGVSQVGVLPTHRRQGIFTALMAQVHDDARQRGEPIAALIASESTIYRRFGYGVGVTTSAVEIERAHAQFRRPTAVAGNVRMVGPDEMGTVLPPIHDRYRREQPGEMSRSPAWWARRLADPEDRRGDAGDRFAVVWGSTGYVTYRMRPRWEDAGPNYVIKVEELIAVTDEARAGLLQYCAGVDLVGMVKMGNVPVDEPLRWMLTDGRRLRVTSTKDFLWLALLDVEAALTARGYATDDEVVLDVMDAGRYRVGRGVCRRTETTPDLRLDVADLAAAYLGGVRFTTLARAGLVAELSPGALARADALFATTSAPFCCTFF